MSISTEVGSFFLIIYPLLILFPCHLHQIPSLSLSPPLTEYASPSVRSVMQNHMTTSLPNYRTSLIRWRRHTPPLTTSLPTTAPLETHPSSHPAASYKDPPPPPPTLEIIFQELTVSGINNVCSSLLFFFTSYLLILGINANKWRRQGFSLPLPPSPTPPAEAWRGRSIYLPNRKLQGGWHIS